MNDQNSNAQNDDQASCGTASPEQEVNQAEIEKELEEILGGDGSESPVEGDGGDQDDEMAPVADEVLPADDSCDTEGGGCGGGTSCAG